MAEHDLTTDFKIQSIVGQLPNSEYKLHQLLDGSDLTKDEYRRLVNALTMRIRSYALEEVTRTEYQWKARTEKFVFTLILMFPALVAVICFATRCLR